MIKEVFEEENIDFRVVNYIKLNNSKFIFIFLKGIE